MGEVIDIRQVIDAGGSVEGNKGSEGTKNLQVYTTDSGKKRLYSSPEAVPQPKAGVKIDTKTGKITVDIPEKWQNDEQVKKYIDNYMLQTVSANYKADKNVEYQDPFDETKKIKTEEWIKKLNEALQFRVQALNVTPLAKAELISMHGGTDDKNKVINEMTTDDVIIMSSKFDEDDSWVPMPAYMLLAYPEIENLESYTNGWVKKKDFMDNLYNIKNGKITEANAHGIASTPEKMLSEVEDMSPEEIAKTVAFGNFIHQVDPKRSNWQQFLQAGDALSRGFYGGVYDWFIESSDLITGIASLSFITGDPVDTRGFWNGLTSFGKGEFDAAKYMGESMQDMALTNKDALSKAQAGYVQGRIAGQAVDTVVSMVAVGEATKALSNFITTRITSKGAISVADKMANSSTAISSSTALTTPEVAEASSLADMSKNAATFKNAAIGSSAYQSFFKQTLGGALDLYSKSVIGTSAALGAMDAAKFANIINSASRIATAANFANTAVGVLGNMVFAAVVGNKELTTKVLTSNATSEEAKNWVQQLLWETGEITALSYATNLAVDTFGRPLANSKTAEWVRSTKQKASQKFTGFTERLSTPWLNFMQWYNNNRAAAAKATTGAATNARAARGEAIKEAVLANEARAYGAHLSTEPGSYGMKVVEEALRSSGVQPGVTMSETLENLARAGIVFDPANLNLSEYEAWQSNMAGLRVAESNWGAIDENISQVVHEFSSPDIYPMISEQLSEVNKANSKMLQLEEAQGLLSKPEIKKNKGLLKKDEGFIYANHSRELSRYIVRGYELRVIANEGRALGHQNLEEYKPYVEAKTRLEEASKGLSPRLREIADKQYVPALANAERNIIDVMVNDGVYPRAFVEAMRASGKFGTDGKDWLRLVARQDTPKGAYTPFSGTVKEDNTISINRFRVLDDEDITWPGNGLQKLIEEYGISRAEKALVKAGKQATGKTTEVVVSGEKTRSAGLMKEFKGEFLSAVKQGIKSFVQTASGTVAIGKTRSAEQSAFLKEVADIGGVETIDIDSLRAIMKEKGLPMAEDILDQESLDKFLEESSDEAKELLLEVVGEKIEQPVIDHANSENTLNYLEKRINEKFPKRRFEELKKSLQSKYDRGLKYSNTSSSKELHKMAINTQDKIKNGEISENDKLIDFAKQMFDSDSVKDQLRSGEFLAYTDIINGNIENSEYIDYIPKKQLKSLVQNYRDIKNESTLETPGTIDFRVNENGVKVKKVPIGEHEVELDYTIADRISELNKAGYDTYNSHSGISTEHKSKSDIGKGYIQFNGNLSPEKIENIKSAADKANMDVVEELNPVYGKTITVYQDKAADGTSNSEIVKQANQLTYKKMNVPESEAGKEWGWIWNLDNEGFSKAWDYRDAKIDELYKKHGGDALPDDAARNESWDKFFDSLGIKRSSEEARKLTIDTVGEKMGVTDITEEMFPELMKNETVQKILRGELEKTSLQTGYGIKDTRARLNAQVPGFDVLDWSLLSREHVNGLMPGGFYHGKDNNYVRAYIIDLKDLRKITGLDRNTEDMSEDAINRITKDINLNGGGAILPIEFDTVSGDRRFYPMTRGEYSKFPDWETYFNYLESLGVTKVPVAIDFSKKALAHEAILGSFLDKIDKAIATGKKPDVTMEEVAIALREFRTRDRVIKRLRDSAPEEEYSWKDIRKIVEDAEKYNAEVAAELINEKFDDSLISDQAKERLKIQNFFNDVNAKDITSDVQEAFSEYGKIPFFHGQMKPLGTIEYNDPDKVPEDIYRGAGDAYWLSPNASYVNNYGPNKLAGTIPVKYFMSDKEKADIIQKVKKELEKIDEDTVDKVRKIYLDSRKWMESRLKTDDDITKRAKDLFKSGVITESEQIDVLASDLIENGTGSEKKAAQKYKSARNIYAGPPEHTEEDIDNIASGKLKENILKRDAFEKIIGANSRYTDYSPNDIESYRALAEYAGKPVIDISEDGFADGTAFFYYKDIDPKFDEEIGKQLEAQAMASNYQLTPTSSKEFVKWAKNTTVKDILSLIDYKYESASSDVMKLEQIFEDADKLKGAEKKKFINSKKVDIAEIDASLGRNLTKDAIKWDEDSRITDSFSKIYRDILGWINSNINKPSVYNNSILNKKIFNAGIDSKWLESTMNDAEYSPLQAFEIRDPAVTEEKIAEWNAIDPRNIENVPTEPEFKQPQKVSYQDYERGLAEDAGLNETILEALRGEQFNKLSDLKNTNNREYENLLDKLDRANAKASNDVKQSGEVQVAADEYRKNIKDFENAVLFNQKFSYMIKAQTSKNTMTAFAEKNGITLPEGKGSAKNKMKSALWQMLVDGKELPAIKGLKKTDVKNIKNNLEIFKDTEESEAINKQFKKNFYKMLDETDLFKNAGGPNPLKYELDEEAIYNDIDEAIGDMITRIKLSPDANAAIEGIILNQGYQMSDVRYEFTVLDQILSKEMKKELSGTIEELSRKIVDNLIPKSSLVIKGNIGSLYKKVETAINDKLEARFAAAKTTLETMGEEVESATITQLLEKYNSEIKGASEDPTIIKTMDENGEIQYERVSPTLASIYNERPTYSPMSTPMKVLNNLAILKKINQTDFSPRSFAKQTVSDPAMAFATVGALPGTLHAIRDEIASHFGPALLRAMEKNDPLRFNNIKAIADREGISMEEAFKRNSEAIAKTQVPFTLLNNELLRQAKISKFGNDGVAEMNRRTLNEKINDGLRKASDKFGFFQNKRETYTRLYAGEKAFMDALRKGYNLEQAENFREYALNTATTNFRTKHSMFNMLRSTVPYLTSGISGAKSFWQMFELDPIGVTSRIFSGFIAPILYFAGEIFSDENLKKKYEALAESEKENHIVIAIGGELILIPVGEEIGKYTNIVMHAVENMHEENQYEFWSLMLNDLVSLIPGADFTGFTDPEMWGDLSGEAPTFLEVMDNGIAKMLSGTMPPVVQSMVLGFTGRDLYTGRKIDTSRVTIDEDGNPTIMSYSTSQFAKALANMVGGDAKVIERVVSGTVGTVTLHVLDTITSAVQYVVPGGEEGSLTTGVEKALSDFSAPFATHGYNSLERRFNYGVAALYREKEKIEKNKVYIKYNQDIASEKDPKRRQTLINKRNEMFAEYMKKVEALVKGYRAAGGNLDKWNFSKAVSLIVFEDAVRSDRQFMDINTNYTDAYKQAMQTLYDMGITNPEGPSSLGYIYTDDDGKPQLAMWTPAQMQIMQNQFYEQGNIHAARIKAIIDNGKSDSLKKQRQVEGDAEQPYWDKYNATGKLSSDEWDAIDDLRKAYNAKVVLALKEYMDTYGASSVLSNDAVIDYLRDIIKVPSSYEKVKGRYISSGAGKLNKQDGFAESYIKTIFGVK